MYRHPTFEQLPPHHLRHSTKNDRCRQRTAIQSSSDYYEYHFLHESNVQQYLVIPFHRRGEARSTRCHRATDRCTAARVPSRPAEQGIIAAPPSTTKYQILRSQAGPTGKKKSSGGYAFHTQNIKMVHCMRGRRFIRSDLFARRGEAFSDRYNYTADR